MLFNSFAFIFLYLPLVFAGMFMIGRRNHRLAALWLGAASVAFYAVWDVRFVILLMASVCFNYSAGYWIGLSRNTHESKKAKLFLVVAIGCNLMLLSYFKYANFMVVSVNQVFGLQIPGLDIIMPLGISFFTFTQIAFLVDVYRGNANEYRFIHYLLFVTYFPHLIAGPILHHKQMMPQFANPATYHINVEHVAVGLTAFVFGLAKKVLIADNLAEYATPVFNAVRDGHALMLFEAWIGALSYTLQLYFDFSGYSDMAIGLSLMLNIRLPLNFNSPYKATNIIDFWRRWHMTLSNFLRDYLYIPLGGNRKGPARRYLNLMATMLLGGLWHGAGWTFILWGGLHGLYLVINHGWHELKGRLGWGEGGRLAKFTGGGITFLAVVVAWVFFRADSFVSAWTLLSGMAGLNGVSLPVTIQSRVASLAGEFVSLHLVFKGLAPSTSVSPVGVSLSIAMGLALVWLFPNVQQILANYRPAWDNMAGKKAQEAVSGGRIASALHWKLDYRYAVPTGMMFFLALLYMASNKVSEFLYFQF
jgi:alginate O-acetyltransferase complex protein AlgI